MAPTINDQEKTSPGGVTAIPPTPAWPPAKQIVGGSIAVVLWLALFSTGLLIDSLPYRKTLGWKPDDPAKVENQLKVAEKRLGELERINAIPPAKREGKEQATPAMPDAMPAIPKETHDMFSAFVIAALTFIPSNIALLCVIAAFLGGCSVSQELINDVHAEARQRMGHPEEFTLSRRLNYLKEHPAFSAFRGLVVFLLLISGLFVLGGSETLATSEEQIGNFGKYIRFAGIFSFIGYLAGHDPTIFTALLRFGSGHLNGATTGRDAGPNDAKAGGELGRNQDGESRRPEKSQTAKGP